MKRILDNIKNTNDNKHERFVYRLVFIGCVVVHFIFVLFFGMLHSVAMTCFNVVSVLLYSVLIYLTDRASLKAIGSIAYMEISIHSVMATLTLGWGFGFALYLICVVPLSFYISYKKIGTSFLMSLIAVAMFTTLKYVTSLDWFIPLNPQHLSGGAVNAVYIGNSIVSFIMLLALSLVYNVYRTRAQNSLAKKNEILLELAYTDPLTKLSNRHSMYEHLDECHEQALKDGKPFTILLADIDDFKLINDTHGHNNGDMVLKRIANIFKENVPEGADVCRWGGEEVLVLLPEYGLDEGAELADKLRKIVEAEVFDSGKKEFSVTMTFGVCENKGQYGVDKMVSNADKNLYSGKRSGKNCVVC